MPYTRHLPRCNKMPTLETIMWQSPRTSSPSPTPLLPITFLGRRVSYPFLTHLTPDPPPLFDLPLFRTRVSTSQRLPFTLSSQSIVVLCVRINESNQFKGCFTIPLLLRKRCQLQLPQCCLSFFFSPCSALTNPQKSLKPYLTFPNLTKIQTVFMRFLNAIVPI